MSFTPYDNSIRWYHDTYHQLKKWIDVNIVEDVSQVIKDTYELPLVKLDKEGALYHRMLSHMSLLLGPPDRLHSEVEINRLRIITALIVANNRGKLFEVMDVLDPDNDMYSYCTVIV